LTLGGTAPDAVIDPVEQGVLQAGRLDRTVNADAACDLDPDAIVGEEDRGGMSWHLPAVIHSVSMSPPFLRQRCDWPIGSWADRFLDGVRRRRVPGWAPTNLEPSPDCPTGRPGVTDAEEETMSQLPEDLEAPQPPRGHV